MADDAPQRGLPKVPRITLDRRIYNLQALSAEGKPHRIPHQPETRCLANCSELDTLEHSSLYRMRAKREVLRRIRS